MSERYVARILTLLLDRELGRWILEMILERIDLRLLPKYPPQLATSGVGMRKYPKPVVDLQTHFKLIGHSLHEQLSTLSALNDHAFNTAASGTQPNRSKDEILLEAKTKKRKLTPQEIKSLSEEPQQTQFKIALESKVVAGRTQLDLLAFNGRVINVGHSILLNADQFALDSSMAKAELYAKEQTCQVWIICISTSTMPEGRDLLLPETDGDDPVSPPSVHVISFASMSAPK